MSLRLCFSVGLLVGACCAGAHGFVPAPISYFEPSADGSRLLVMLNWENDYDRKHGPTFMLPSGEIVCLRDAFPSSGCYDAATLQPIWQVNWFAYRDELLTSPDFASIARLNIHAMRHGAALEFFKNGNRVRTYQCDDLLRHLNSEVFFRWTSCSWHSVWYDECELTADGGVKVSTARRRVFVYEPIDLTCIDLGYQEQYVFDFRTGAMQSCEYLGVGRLLLHVLAVIATPAALIIVPWFAWRWIRARLPSVRIRNGLCPACAYDLTGNLSGVCPECGRPALERYNATESRSCNSNA